MLFLARLDECSYIEEEEVVVEIVVEGRVGEEEEEIALSIVFGLMGMGGTEALVDVGGVAERSESFPDEGILEALLAVAVE